jgi:DNA-directed RNA polymerase specialized sigma24 family protein
MDDDELVARVAAGGDPALRELFDRHAPWLAARLRASLPAADVEDVLQETFLAAWRGARGYRPQGACGGWLWGIARHQAALLLRRRGAATAMLPAAPELDQPDADPAETVLARAGLADAVAALGPDGSPEREVWRLFVAGLTAAVLGVLGLPAGSGGRWLRRSAAIITVAGLAAAGTAVALAGTGRLDPHGMIIIPALHDAASDEPIRYAPVCSRTAIPVCLNPAYAAYLPTVTAALGPELGQLAGLPGAPASLTQTAQVYQQGPGNSLNLLVHMPPASDGRKTFVLPDQLPGFQSETRAQFVAQLQLSTGLGTVASVIGSESRSPALPAVADPAQQAVISALTGLRRPQSLRVFENTTPGAALGPVTRLLPEPGSPAAAAAKRFADLTPAARHAWLVQHLAALRAGNVSLAQLP